MNKTKLLIICCALLSITSFAQNSPACSPVGTWYGGSDVKYLLTITPITGERFAARAEPVLDIATIGDPAWTSWSGQLARLAPNRYLGQYISMYTTSSQVPPPPDSYELDGVRGYLSFYDCDHISIAYDYYLVYFDLSKIAFVDTPDFIVDLTGLVEHYQLMPMTCPACVPSSAPTTQLRQKR